MALSIQLGFPDVPKSVTNPYVNIKDVLDKDEPLSFLEFIKLINVSFEPDTLQNYYTFYLKEWNSHNTSTPLDNNTLIVERYRDFIREISINYSTPEEKKFLSLIDFNDPLDLDIAIGFYGRKLKELSLFYNDKREDVKFNIIRNKLKGTVFGTEKSISDLTLSYLKNYSDGKMLFDYSAIQEKLEIEIEELYDTYPQYFNQDPDPLIYDNKDLDYGYDIFLKSNEELISEIFSGISEELKKIKEVDQLFDNKRKLTQKYITTDFYYLSTGSTVTNFISGKLFQSENPPLNFKNRYYPTTASTESGNNLKTNRELGFFRPCKTSIVLVDGVNYEFSINVNNLLPNSLYYFPDPNIFGKNGDILTFIVDDSHLKRNFSSGKAANQPNSESNDTKYYGYVSETLPTTEKYLDNIFDSGFVKDIKSDVYGNLFGLFKNDHRFRKTIEYITSPTVYNVLFNGYQFYDDLYNEAYSFKYNTSDDLTYRETTRSGLSTNTGTFDSTDVDVSLFFGFFTPYNELISPTESNLVTSYTILENAFIAKDDFSLYDESSSSDLSSFEFDAGSFYYTTLIDAGINSYNPLTRGLYDPIYPSISSSFIQYPTISALNIIDGGWINDNAVFNVSLNADGYQYINTTDITSHYTLSTQEYVNNFELNGNIFVKNAIYKTTNTLLNTFPYLLSRYQSSVVNELSANVIKFEIANDVMFIQTNSYLTINKILMIDGVFEDPKTNSILITHSSTPFEVLSNRFKHNNEVFYSKLLTTNYPISSNNFIIYPEIYKLDLINFKNTKIFPTSQNDITDFFNISGVDIRFVKCSSSTLSYSSKNNIFNISFILKDQNEMSNLHELDFKLTPTVEFINHSIVNFKSNSYSNIMSSLGTISPVLSSSTPLFSNEELVL
jgi:hypothetical protein